MKPTFTDAPGIAIRERKNNYVAYWQCRTDIRKMGFRPSAVPLWKGIEPTLDQRAYVSDYCQRMQAEMLGWAAGELRKPRVYTYDGTVASLILCYRNDPDSPYNKNTRFHTRRYYDSLCKRIHEDHGAELVLELRARQMLRWHEAWSSAGHVAMAHSLMRMTRMLLGFWMTILECEESARMCAVMGKMRFKQSQPRTETLTAEMATAIRAQAHADGLPSVALAQAIQFDAMLRQKDVIGEWVPEDEPGPAIVSHAGRKWARGLLWSEIDGALVLRHVTSKRQKEIELRLSDAPMVMEELAKLGGRPAFGPIVVSERTGRPWRSNDFRRAWRKIADKVGVPKSVRNMDSRAGAITEATDAGAELEAIKHAATHSDISMTQRYARGGAQKAARVLQLRAAHRIKKEPA